MPRSSKWNDFAKNVKQRAEEEYNFVFPDDEEASQSKDKNP